MWYLWCDMMWCDVMWCDGVRKNDRRVRQADIYCDISLSLSCDWTESPTASSRDASVSPASQLAPSALETWRVSYFPIFRRFLLSEKTSYHFKKYFQSSPSDDWSDGSDQSLLTDTKRSRSRVEDCSDQRFRRQLSYGIKTHLKACKMQNVAIWCPWGVLLWHRPWPIRAQYPDWSGVLHSAPGRCSPSSPGGSSSTPWLLGDMKETHSSCL